MPDEPMRTIFTLEWNFTAPPAAVFRSWTDPERLDWFSVPGQPKGATPTTVDLRVGGTWRQEVVVLPGSSYFTGGVYREIVPNEKLVFAYGAVGGLPELGGGAIDDAPIITLTFAEARIGTRLTLDFAMPERIDTAPVEDLLEAMERGLKSTVDQLSTSRLG